MSQENKPKTGLLEAIYSERDRSGNVYWAIRYTDLATGKIAQGLHVGGESNIYAIIQCWSGNDWDRSIIFRKIGMQKKAFRALTGDWTYAGCSPEDLAAFIKKTIGLADCPSCERPRPNAVGPNAFEPGSVCPHCGHVEPKDEE